LVQIYFNYLIKLLVMRLLLSNPNTICEPRPFASRNEKKTKIYSFENKKKSTAVV